MKRFAPASVLAIFLLLFFSSLIFAQGESAAPLREVEEAALKLFDRVSDSVVAIHCKAKVPGVQPMRRPRLPRMPSDSAPGEGKYFGTGVLFSSDGYILTSTSVVPEDGKEIKVTLRSGKEYTAELIGSEKRNNVTLIKIDCENLPFCRLGNSSAVRVGQLAFTVANPYDSIKNDCQPAFSMGIVSGIYRLRGGDGDYVGTVIETDSALNAGSDGGPLFDSKGDVIGILNLSYSYSRWLGIAVPIDQIKFILEDLKADREIYPEFGLTTEEEPSPGGVAVEKVSENGPAAKAGLRTGDIILEVDGKKVRKPDHVTGELTLLPPASRVTMLVRRGEEELVIQIVSDKIVKERKRLTPGYLGAVAAEKDPNPGAGVLVESVRPDSAAEKAGIKAGDRVLKINEKPVNSVLEAEEILRTLHAGEKIKLLLQRGEEKKELEVVLGPRPKK